MKKKRNRKKPLRPNRKLHHSVILVIALITIGYLISIFYSIARAQEPVVVNVANTLQTNVTGGARQGINLNYWWDDQANRVPGARTLPAALGDMGAKYWRFPGGEKADGYLWSTSPFNISNPRLARISSQDWPSNDPLYWTPAGSTSGNWAHDIYNFDEFMADCQMQNCQPVIVVAYDGIYKNANAGGESLTRQEAIDTAVAWVNYANKVKGYDIKYWEIGNETWNPGYMGGDPGRSQQAQDFIEFCQAMKNVDSTIWCGISTDTQGDWSTLLSIAASSIDFLSVHSYEAWPYSNYSSYAQSNLYPNSKVDAAWNALQNYSAHKDRIKIMVTETGGITYGTQGTWTQADLGHALMTFDIMAQLQQDKRVEFTQFWNSRWNNQNSQGNIWPPNQSEFDALKPDNSFSPQGTAINILADYSLTNMVGTTSTSAVRTFASHDPASGKLNIWLINKNTAPSTTTVSMQNYSPPSSGSISVLKGSGSTDMNPTFSQTGTVAVTNNQINITLDPISITVIELGTSSPPTPTSTITPTQELTAPPTATPTPISTNLALNRPTTVSSVQKGDYGGNRAVDGNTSTRWWTRKVSKLSTEWITVDLGVSNTIGRVTIIQGDRYAKVYAIKTSQNGTAWTTVITTTTGTQGSTTHTFSPTTARYIKMESTAWFNSGDRLKLLELQVYQ